MNIKDFKTNPDCTFRCVECKMKIKQHILSDRGRIELSGNNEYKYLSKDSIFEFTISDENITKLVSDFIQRHYYNLVQIEIISNDKDIFFLHISFFYSMDRFGKLDIILNDDLKKQLIEKRLINKNKDIYEQIIDNFILTDGNNEYFAYTAGNYYTKDYDLEYSEETESLEDSTLNDLKNQKSKAIKIYGAEYSFQISITGNEFEESLVAEKIDFSKRKVPRMAMAMGSLAFTDRSSYVSAKVKKILNESPGYLDLWNKYADLEGAFLLNKARKVGLLHIDRENINVDGDNILVYLMGDIENAKKLLSNGDYLFFSDEMPSYIEDESFSWRQYRDSDVDSNAGQDIAKGKHVKIVSFNQNGTMTLEYEDTSAPYITYSIRGDKNQIINRETARKMIADGESANPMLGLIIDGKLPDGLVNCVKNNKIEPLSDYVKNKIFKNEPTPTQREAISIALNTPDIAIIQGPPGTGKTTVITAIIERLNELADKRIVNKGQILITSFQHDAVRNVIERLSINSLPTIKYGAKGDVDISAEDAIEKWCHEIGEKLKTKNPSIKETAEQRELLRLHNFYLLSPSSRNALSFLKFAKQFNFDREINEEIDILIEEFEIHTVDSNDRLLSSVRRIRTTKSGFDDDGSEKADDVLEQIEKIIDSNNEENAFIVKTLEQAALNKNGITNELLIDLEKAKRILLEKCIPRPIYQVEKPREEIIDIYTKIKNDYRKPQNEMDEILYEFLNELTNNPLAVTKSIEAYNFVYAATTGQSVGKDIKRAKGLSRKEHPIYNTVIVDEAARVNPGDLLIPLAQAERRIILVGDHRQLPHIYDEEIFENLQTAGNIDNENDIKITLFQYLMNQASELTEKDGIPRTITLDAQYRMHPLLGKFISDNFYKQYGENFESPLGVSYFEQHLREKPVVWVRMDHGDGDKPKGTSRVRLCEADFIVETIEKWIHSEEGKNLSYGVISFYRAQVDEITRKLGKLADKVRVGTVDAFQGMEFDVIFLSVVRSSKKLPKNIDWNLFSNVFSDSEQLKADQDNHIAGIGQNVYGFLTSENRLCVSLSRQIKLLVVVGSGDIFSAGKWGLIAEKCVPAMKKLYELCVEEEVIVNGETESI